MVKSCKNCRTAKKADFIPCHTCDPNRPIIEEAQKSNCAKCRTRLIKDFKQCNACFLLDQEEVVDIDMCFVCHTVNRFETDDEEEIKLYKNVSHRGVTTILCEGCVMKLNNAVVGDYQVNLKFKEAAMFVAREDEDDDEGN